MITDYKFFEIKIKNQIRYDDSLEINPNRYKKYKLLYQIRQYEKLPCQDYEYITRLRKSGVKVITKKKKINGKVSVEYFKEYAVVDKSFKYRNMLVEKILSKEVSDKEVEFNIIHEIYGEEEKVIVDIVKSNQVTTTEDFLRYQNRKNVKKTTQDNLYDEYLTVLDTLSSYLMCDEKLANCINKTHPKETSLTDAHTLAEKKKKKRSYSPTPKQQKEDYEKWKAKNKRQVKRWHKSKTYKINNLYSYVGNKNEIMWDWIKKDWVKIDSPFDNEIKRLIDVTKPYLVEWCVVDTENNFSFNGQKYSISQNVKSYQVKGKSEYINGKLNDFTNESEMEQVLCFYVPHKDRYHFFDENINPIDIRFINPKDCVC